MKTEGSFLQLPDIANSTDLGHITRDLYFDLLARSLMNEIYWEAEVSIQPATLWGFLEKRFRRALLAHGLHFVRVSPIDRSACTEGRAWPVFAHTMIGAARLNNLRSCVQDVLENQIPGDLIETGVWRGGACIMMRAILKAYGIRDRQVWVADSFEGLPRPNPERFPADAGATWHLHKRLAVSLEQVRANFKRYGLLDDQVHFLRGWFRDTLPNAPITKLAVLRLDGDMYEATMESLDNLYPKLSAGGYVIVDDFGAVPACRQAVYDYRTAHGITEPIEEIDWTGIYWQRSR
jgi:O-methyltransferase